MAIGEAFLSAFLQVLFDRLASNEFTCMLFGKSYDELLEKLKITLLSVTALLGDAEEKQFHSPAVVRWLHAARDGMYDAEDLLDELATEALKCCSKLESWNSLTARVSSTLTPTSSGGKSMESRLGKVVERLEMVAKYKNVLGLRERAGGGSGTERRLETTSLVDERSVLGRHGDKETIVAALLSEEGKCDVGVVPIVGMGGIGKTTLAQLAYNDERVFERFEIRVWVCVTDRFDPVRVTRTILGSGGSRSDTDHDEGFDSLQVRLREKLEGKRFLVVFDDVWEKRNGDWDRLWKPMRSGKRGSKVIATTRNTDVAASLGTVPAHRLRRLSDEDCWVVFSRQVSEAGITPSLKSVGEKIAKRCEGLPMAAKRFGVLLRSRSREDEWNDVSSQRIWDSPSEESDILRILSPTYLHLPSHLKQCFAFFAVFPPGHEYDKSSLIAMWMSEGFLRKPKGKRRMEEVGDEYFREFVLRSVLEPSFDNPSRFIIHGLLKELADFVAGDFCFRLEESNEDGVFEKARHSSYIRGNRDELTRFEAFNRVKQLRTFLPLDPMIDNIGVSYLADNVPRELLPKLRYLRVLSFSSCRLTKLPNSIGNLRHLRYLNLSRTAIKSLPESTNELYNLQTLDLSQCRYLTKLPSKMGNLKFLLNLFINGTRLREMPLQMCELRNLQKLTNFVVGYNSGSGIKDLGRLSQLCGSLQISGLENVLGFIDAIEANMKEKRELNRIVFQWNSFGDSCADESYEEELAYFPQQQDISTRGYKSKRFPTFHETVNEYAQDSVGSEHAENPRDKRAETLVLEMLQPHTNIKKVTIRGFGGTAFPKWIESPLFSHIKYLKLSNCKICSDLPAMGQLPSLEDLVLEGMERVKRVGVEFYGDEQLLKSPFSSLKTLKFENMMSLEEWLSSGTENGGEDFPLLQKIEMQNCPKLKKFPIGLGFPSLLELSVWACPKLKELPGGFPSLTMLEINGCRDMTKLPNLLSIRDLELSNCNKATVQTIPELDSLSYLRLCQIPNLARLSNEFFESLTALQELHIADMSDLAALADLRKIHSLERMEISGCTVLEELPRSLSEFSALKELRVWACPSLADFSATTGLPSTLKGLEIRDCESLQSLPDLKSSSSLEYLIIEGCSSITSFPWDELPRTLKELEIQDCERLQSIIKEETTINDEESSLEILTIGGCRSIVGFHFSSFNLKELTVQGCPSLTRLPDGLHSLTRLEISDCPALVKFHEAGPPGSRAWAALRTVSLSNLLGLESLPARTHTLEELSLESCPNIADFPEGGLPVSLVSLSVLNCENLRPSFRWGLHRLTRLAELAFGGCGGLKEFPDNWLLPNSLLSLQLQRLPSLRSLPRGLENLSRLAYLEVWGCDNLRTDKDQLSMLQKFDLWNVL